METRSGGPASNFDFRNARKRGRLQACDRMASLWNKDSPKFCTVGIKLEDAEATELGVVGNATSTTGKILITDTAEMVKAMASVWGAYSQRNLSMKKK